MNNLDISITSMLLNASLFVQIVVLILVLLSILSWAIIIGKASKLKRAKQMNQNFTSQFWSGGNLADLYQGSLREIRTNNTANLSPNERIFVAGMNEYQKIKNLELEQETEITLDSIQRSINISLQQENDNLENGLAFLGSVASAAPYIGLLGTVWGIMHAFTGLSALSEVTLATVAPGIAEALVATAIGLMAAIPAVLAYNYFSRQNDRIALQTESFSEDFINIMHRNLLVQNNPKND